MVRGPKHHLKRLNAPKNWHLSKMKGIYAPKPSSGPHSSSSCLPLTVLLRNLLPYANSAAEAKLILERGNILVNGKVRLDPSYPAGLLDVISIPLLKKTFRLVYSPSGDWKMCSLLSSDEALSAPLPQQLLSSSSSLSSLSSPNQSKEDHLSCLLIVKVKKTGVGNKKMVGKNRAAETKEQESIPWCTTECGRILRFVSKEISKNDSVVLEVKSKEVKSNRKFQRMNFKDEVEVKDFIKMEEGKTVMVCKGKNKGRVGKIKFVEKHLKIGDVVFVEDELGNQFVTKKEDIIVIGRDKSIIGLDNGRGVRMNLDEKIKFSLKNIEKGNNVVETV